jgi:trigger factor
MYTYKKNSLPKNTLEILVNIPRQDIKEAYEKSFFLLQKDLVVPGFRKGTVPKKIAEKNIKKEEVYEKLIPQLLSKIYTEILKKENFTPIISPKVELIKAKEDEDWEVKFIIALKPDINLTDDYKKLIKEAKANQKKDEIWVPGKDQKNNPKENDVKKQKLLNDILNVLLKNITCEIADFVIEEELNQRLANLFDEIKKIGLTVEAYLKSKKLTIDQLKTEYRKEIEEAYKLEFILLAIADKENITVEKSDLEKIFANFRNEEERKLAETNSYFYASILRKQKTLDYLLSL